MKVLHLEYSGKTGGIEKLCKDIGLNSKYDQHIFWFVHEGGTLYEEMVKEHLQVKCLNLKNNHITKLYHCICDYTCNSGIDVVIVHHPSPLVWLAIKLYLCRKRRAKVIIYAHSNYNEIIGGKDYRRWIYGNLLKFCDGVIAISEYVKRSLIVNTKVQEHKVKVIYNGVVCPEQIEVGDGRFHTPIHLMYVGRLIEKKGVQVLVEAFSELAHKEKYILDIVGDGPYKSILEDQARQLNLEQNIIFHGNKRDIATRLQNTGVFIHPAICEEGFGITIIEAMSYGVICIASRKGAIPEIIKDKENGFLVEATNSSALARKIEDVCEILTDTQRERIKKNAYARSKDFSIEVLLNELHEFLTSV